MYLDIRGCDAGERLLGDADNMFSLMDQFFDLPMEEKAKCDFSSQGSYFGYKGKGREVMDDQGTKDHNEMYNVSWPPDHKYSSSVCEADSPHFIDLQR